MKMRVTNIMNLNVCWHYICLQYNNAKRNISVHTSFFNDANPDLQIWPVTSKINSVYSPAMINMSAKFDADAHNGSVVIMLTSLFPHISGSGGVRVVKLLDCGARGSVFDSRSRHFNFRVWFISPASKSRYS